jgi:hypothetical protein
MNNHIIEHNKIRRFILAGNSHFTVVNVITNNRLTFRIVRPKEKGPWFVWATNKKGKYGFLGTIFQRESGLEYRYGQRHGKFIEKSVVNKSFKYLWKKMLSDSLPTEVVFYSDSRCGRCGQRLTDPKSIKRGFGSWCFSVLVKEWKAAHV